MTATREETIRSYIGDLIAVVDHVAEALAKQAGDNDLRRVPRVGGVIDSARLVLVRHQADLQAHVKSMGGASGGGVIKDMLSSAAGVAAGLYGKMRGETVSRIIRDDYTALSFLTACTTMLHTTALALNDTATADMTRRQLNDYPPLIMALSELLPHAVVADLGSDDISVVSPGAADQAAQDAGDAWRRAPHFSGV